MCGIAGMIALDPTVIQRHTLSAMSGSLRHRGPDDETAWINDTGHVGFSHTRLCVIDKSKGAGQPMHYLNRYTIIYNGEIYNYKELRVSLEKIGYQFRSNSDTEVILASFAAYGDRCLESFDGMFAFAIWDDVNKQLFCARDRFGEKPLYYFSDVSSGILYLASELKAFYAASVERRVNNEMLFRFLVLGQTSNPENMSSTFDERIQRLPASHFLLYSLTDRRLTVKRYWSLGKDTSFIDFRSAVSKTRELLSASISRRLRSDVPVGISLSGGLDSSAIAAVVAGIHQHPLRTFTAVFPGFDKDESRKARKVADTVGFKNLQVQLSATDFVNDFERLIRCQEEPFTSASVYAQYKVFELAASNNVTVLLDGQGADETLAGYDKYRKWMMRSLFPQTTASILNYREQIRINRNQFLDDDFHSSFARNIKTNKPVTRELNDLLYYDVFCGGLEELLRYADRNSMAHGREVRLPYLNHDLVSFIFSLPSTFKIGHGYTKMILREAMRDKLPLEITHTRKKIGFEPPQENWMKYKAVQDLVMESRDMLVKHGVLSKKILQIKPEAHSAYVKRSVEWRRLVAGAWIGLK